MPSTTKLRFYKDLKAALRQSDCPKRIAYSIMQLVFESFYHLDRQIVCIWDVADVYELRPELTPEQAKHVLKEADRGQDVTGGIDWAILAKHADRLYP